MRVSVAQDDGSALGQAFQAARRSAGLTQAVLADAVGLTRGSISQFEQGAARPSGASAGHIVSVLRERGAGESTIADLMRALASAGIDDPSLSASAVQHDGPAEPRRIINYMESLARPHRVVAVLLCHLRADPTRWERFCVDYEVFCTAAGVSSGTVRLAVAFLRATVDLQGIIGWSDSLNAADTRLLLHACTFSLAPVEYAQAGLLSLNVPLPGSGWQLRDQLLSLVALPPAVAAAVDGALEAPHPEQ